MLNKLFTTICITALCITAATGGYAQKQKKGKAADQKTEVSATIKDSTKQAAAAPKGIPTLAKFVKPSARIMRGFTTVYKQDNKFYITINDSIIGRDIRVVTRISKSAEGIRSSFSGYAGDIINSAMFRFEKGPNDKIFLKSILFEERSNEKMPQNVENSNFPAIAASFDIKAQSSDKTESIIDVTDFLLSDTEYLFFDKSGKTAFKLGGLQKDKSYISDIKTYPINTEIKVVYTYAHQEDNPTATFEINNSFVLLPKVPMTPRYSDPRVGYFTVGYTDFDKNPQRVERTRLITRWRMEPKPEDMEKYKRGELVEPAKPIIYYIDPATPKEWVPYLIAGVNDWQKVFEKAGFKNAIYALEAPTFEQDSTWSLEDARHSAIVYKPSDIPNASGPHVNDPRSGEIIESHVNWYHNVMSLLRNWYFIQCSPVDPAARKMTFDTDLMGQLVRFVSSHEIGHTLGLRHNFGATSHFTVEQLRDPDFLKQYGHTTSIMDYSRFNYVAQPGDNIPRELLFPRLSTYDDWVIEWGYRRFPEINDPVKELPKINQWIIEKTKDPLYQFGTESDPNDPRMQAEDLGENQMKANALGVKNLQYIMSHLIEWTSVPGEDYKNLQTLYGEVLGQYTRYMNHVAKWIGGIYGETKNVEQPGALYTHAEKARQQEAMTFLKKYIFEPQQWLVPNDILDKMPNRADAMLENTYNAVFRGLISKRVMMNLLADEIANGAKAYTLENFFADINSNIFAPASADKTKAAYQRILQKSYVDALINLYNYKEKRGNTLKADNTDMASMLFYQLREVQSKLKNAPVSGTLAANAHNKFMIDKIEKALTENKEAK